MSVTDMLYVNQVCHSVRCCVKDGSCSSSSLSASQWTILIDILVSQQMLDAIKHITGDNFFLSGRQRTGALCVLYSPTAAALSINTAFE